FGCARRKTPSPALRAPSPRWGEGPNAWVFPHGGAPRSSRRPRPGGEREGVRGISRVTEDPLHPLPCGHLPHKGGRKCETLLPPRGWAERWIEGCAGRRT